PLLDRPLHSQEPDAILVLHQFADRAHPAVAEMIDVVDLAFAVAQSDQSAYHRDDVFLAQDTYGVGRIEIQPHVHFDATHRGEVIALGIEEQRLEHILRRIERRRLARPHYTIDVEQRVLTRHVLVDAESIADVGAYIDVVDVE